MLDVREHGENGEKVLYRARGTGPTMATLQRRVEDRLVATLPELVRARAGDEPLYCLALHYHLQWPLPPTIGLGLERDRQAWIDRIDDSKIAQAHGVEPGRAHQLPRRDRRLGSQRDRQRAGPGDPGIPDSADDAAQLAELTLNRAARRLQALAWRSITPVTDDFVVYAVDYELTHLTQKPRPQRPSGVPWATRRGRGRRGAIACSSPR